MFKRSKKDEWLLRHEAARTSPVMLRAILLQDEVARPWEITMDHTWRDAFTSLKGALRTPRNIHYSLRAHYERLTDIAVDVLYRYLNPEVQVSIEHFEGEELAIRKALLELDRLNDEAWHREADAADTRGAVKLLLEDATATVADKTFTSRDLT